MLKAFVIVCMVGSMVLLGGCSKSTSPDETVDVLKVLFARYEGNWNVYSMNLDTTGLTLLTNDGREMSSSKNGEKIVFVSNRDGSSEIYTMNANGSGVLRVTTNSDSDGRPTWSPDGSKIVFQSMRSSNEDIYVMNADGTNEQRLTTLAISEHSPTWSPDGTKIAFLSSGVGGDEIYTMNTDGSSPTQITIDGTSKYFISWSPDGTKLLYSGGDGNIYTVTADGSRIITQLTTGSYDNYWPSWSPDGTKIIFYSQRDVESDLYMINSDGTGFTQVNGPNLSDEYPSFMKKSR